MSGGADEVGAATRRRCRHPQLPPHVRGSVASCKGSGRGRGTPATPGPQSPLLPLCPGGFATIYRCTDAESGETFALKHFILTCAPPEFDRPSMAYLPACCSSPARPSHHAAVSAALPAGDTQRRSAMQPPRLA